MPFLTPTDVKDQETGTTYRTAALCYSQPGVKRNFWLHTMYTCTE